MHSLPLPTTAFVPVDGAGYKAWILKEKTEGSLVIAPTCRELKWVKFRDRIANRCSRLVCGEYSHNNFKRVVVRLNPGSSCVMKRQSLILVDHSSYAWADFQYLLNVKSGVAWAKFLTLDSIRIAICNKIRNKTFV